MEQCRECGYPDKRYPDDHAHWCSVGERDELLGDLAAAQEEIDRLNELCTLHDVADLDEIKHIFEDHRRWRKEMPLLSAENQRLKLVVESAVNWLAAAQEENQRLRDGLRRLERVVMPMHAQFKEPRCPICWCKSKEDGGDGHSFDCWLAALLEGK